MKSDSIGGLHLVSPPPLPRRMRCAAAALLVGVVGAVRVPAAALGRASSPMMQQGPPPGGPPPMEELASMFSEEPPSTWGSDDWKWGYADGKAHEEAARVREELAMPHRRSAFLMWAKVGSTDLVDLKMALALSCQNARNGGYDAPDRRWEALMEEMAAAKFMKDGLIVLEDLAAAVNSRLPKPFDMEALEEELEIAEGESLTASDAANSYVIGEALDHLGFRQKGL